MSNHLVHENSPYLLQHAENPVDWYPWGSEALEKARLEDKPIFLSVGYAACHWCHVMAHESFEDHETAAIMNTHFVNIKVDREERPDLDGIYMQAVVAMTGQGGWPMSVFLSPDGRPFFGGTYFPPMRRYNLPSFKEILLSIARLWNEDRAQLVESGAKITQHLENTSTTSQESKPISPASLDKAAFALSQLYDWKHGGWGGAPKFPQPMAIEFLLRRATRGHGASGDKPELEIATHALRAMARGGMYDVIGGGFARYSTDDLWLVPHFEKMLYDNAQLAQTYLHAYLITGDASFRRICEETLDFVSRELTHPAGGFFSSLDADSEGEEGKFYVWSMEEIRRVLEDSDDLSFFFSAYTVTERGNFEGRVVLQRTLDDVELAERFNLTIDQVVAKLRRLHFRLLAERGKRVRPGTDDKILVAWNSLMLSAFSQAARYLKNLDFLAAARRNADFLLTALHPQDRLLRSWREGQARHNAYLEDYAGLILALLELYQSDPDVRWFKSASQLAEEMVEHYRDPAGGLFDTRDDHEKLLLRPKDIQDNATPSGNALAAEALLRLTAYTGRNEWRDLAEQMLGSAQSFTERYPTAFAQWLSALDFAIGPVQEVAILGETADSSTEALINALWSTYRPRLVAAVSSYPPPSGSPYLLNDRPLRNNRPTAYVCQDFICQLPVNEPDGLIEQLK